MSLSDAAKLLAGPIGAFAAAWLGAHFGFRKARKERALDRIVAWHVETIQALARYEERLKRLHVSTAVEIAHFRRSGIAHSDVRARA